MTNNQSKNDHLHNDPNHERDQMLRRLEEFYGRPLSEEQRWKLNNCKTVEETMVMLFSTWPTAMLYFTLREPSKARK